MRLFGSLEQNVTPCGFDLSPSQVFALQELEEKTLTVGEIAQKLWLDRSTVSRLIDNLVKGGFVHRILNEENRREVLVSLTEKGKRSLKQVRKQSIAFYQSILEQVPEEEQHHIQKGFTLFVDALFQKRGENNGK
jgi:DNA-binding MarR family transcriptional regulator